MKIDGVEHTVILIPQPLECAWDWTDNLVAVESYRTVLSDLGSGTFSPPAAVPRLVLSSAPLSPAKWVSEAREGDYRVGTPAALRAPEIILRAGYDTKIDVWAIGCMVRPPFHAHRYRCFVPCLLLCNTKAFEMLTGNWLFPPDPEVSVTPEAYYLALVVSLTGDTFSPAMIERSQLRDRFFQPDGTSTYGEDASTAHSEYLQEASWLLCGLNHWRKPSRITRAFPRMTFPKLRTSFVPACDLIPLKGRLLQRYCGSNGFVTQFYTTTGHSSRYSFT